jgi:hypothetical protein
MHCHRERRDAVARHGYALVGHEVYRDPVVRVRGAFEADLSRQQRGIRDDDASDSRVPLGAVWGGVLHHRVSTVLIEEALGDLLALCPSFCRTRWDPLVPRLIETLHRGRALRVRSAISSRY